MSYHYADHPEDSPITHAKRHMVTWRCVETPDCRVTGIAVDTAAAVAAVNAHHMAAHHVGHWTPDEGDAA